jgi:hypothetical protein
VVLERKNWKVGVGDAVQKLLEIVDVLIFPGIQLKSTFKITVFS